MTFLSGRWSILIPRTNLISAVSRNPSFNPTNRYLFAEASFTLPTYRHRYPISVTTSALLLALNSNEHPFRNSCIRISFRFQGKFYFHSDLTFIIMRVKTKIMFEIRVRVVWTTPISTGRYLFGNHINPWFIYVTHHHHHCTDNGWALIDTERSALIATNHFSAGLLYNTTHQGYITQHSGGSRESTYLSVQYHPPRTDPWT